MRVVRRNVQNIVVSIIFSRQKQLFPKFYSLDYIYKSIS